MEIPELVRLNDSGLMNMGRPTPRSHPPPAPCKNRKERGTPNKVAGTARAQRTAANSVRSLWVARKSVFLIVPSVVFKIPATVRRRSPW